MVEELLQLFIREVDAHLLETIELQEIKEGRGVKVIMEIVIHHEK